jgi:hypothetical protein
MEACAHKDVERSEADQDPCGNLTLVHVLLSCRRWLRNGTLRRIEQKGKFRALNAALVP